MKETTHNSGTRYISHPISPPAEELSLRVAYSTHEKPRVAPGTMRCFPLTSYPFSFIGEATQTHRHRPTNKLRSPLRGLPLPTICIGEQRNEDNSTRKRIQRPHLSNLWRTNEKPLDTTGHNPAPSGNMHQLRLRAEGIHQLASRQPARPHRGSQNLRRPRATAGTVIARSRYVNKKSLINGKKVYVCRSSNIMQTKLSGRRDATQYTAYIPPFPDRLPATNSMGTAVAFCRKRNRSTVPCRITGLRGVKPSMQQSVHSRSVQPCQPFPKGVNMKAIILIYTLVVLIVGIQIGMRIGTDIDDQQDSQEAYIEQYMEDHGY